jgi:hypothetical protein
MEVALQMQNSPKLRGTEHMCGYRESRHAGQAHGTEYQSAKKGRQPMTQREQ